MAALIEVGVQVLIFVGVFTFGRVTMDRTWRRRVKYMSRDTDITIGGQGPTGEVRIMFYEGGDGHATGLLFANEAFKNKREYANMAIGALERALQEQDLAE